MTLSLGVIGCGLKAADYAADWMASDDPPRVVAITDPSTAAMDRFNGILTASGRPAPARAASAEALLEAHADALDAVYVSTPHAFHAPIATLVVRRGLDVLLEKPMAMTAPEARALLAACAEAGATVVVAYQAALSPLLARTRARIAAGEWGALRAVMGEVWEDWDRRYAGGWKQVPALSGGGFLFDTGSHLMNAAVQMAGQGVAEIAAQIDHLGRGIDLVGTAMGRLADGTPLSLTFCGATTPGCGSALTLFLERAIVRLDVWGGWVEVRDAGGTRREAANAEAQEDRGSVLEAFKAARAGGANPSTPERSLHLAELWDAMRDSAARGSARVALTTRP